MLERTFLRDIAAGSHRTRGLSKYRSRGLEKAVPEGEFSGYIIGGYKSKGLSK